MDKEQSLLKAIEEAEANLKFCYVFYQETGEEAVVHDTTLEEACANHPEWSFRYAEHVKDEAYYKWQSVTEDYLFWMRTKDMTDDEYEEYMDSLNHDYELEEYN